MPIRNLLFLDAETWSLLKTLAVSELHSPRNFLRLLIRREWDNHFNKPAETGSAKAKSGVAPSIPPGYHIHQGK